MGANKDHILFLYASNIREMLRKHFLPIHQVLLILMDSGFNILSQLVSFVQSRVDLAFVFLEEWFKEVLVDNSGSLGLWVKQVNEEDELDNVVQWDDGQECAKDAVQKGDKNKDNPVGQPLDIISFVSSLQSLEGHVGWVQEAHKSSDEVTSNAGNNKEYTQNETSSDDVAWLETSLLGQEDDWGAVFKVL